MTDRTANLYRALAVPDVILLATDLEGDLSYLLPHAMVQARARGATLVLAHVVLPAETIAPDGSGARLPVDDERERNARKTLEMVTAEVRTNEIPCQSIVRRGSPAAIIPELVEATGANRVILGTHGQRFWKRFVLGSVADQILRAVQVPAFTVGPHVPWTSAHQAPTKLLHPLSLSIGYEQGARTALEIAQFYNAEITLLHILDSSIHREYDPARAVEWTRSQIERLIPEEAPQWIFSAAQLEIDAAIERILQVAGKTGADLIVLGVSKEVSFWPISNDKTAYEIIARAKCPVLTLRRSVHEQELMPKRAVTAPPLPVAVETERSTLG